MLIVSLLVPGAAMAGAAALGESGGGDGATMACCRKGAKSHNCCPRKAKSSNRGGASIQSPSQCGKTCCPGQLPSPASAVLAAPRTGVAYSPVWVPLLVSGTGSVRPIALPDPLSQRPPPVLLLSL